MTFHRFKSLRYVSRPEILGERRKGSGGMVDHTTASLHSNPASRVKRQSMLHGESIHSVPFPHFPTKEVHSFIATPSLTDIHVRKKSRAYIASILPELLNFNAISPIFIFTLTSYHPMTLRRIPEAPPAIYQTYRVLVPNVQITGAR